MLKKVLGSAFTLTKMSTRDELAGFQLAMVFTPINDTRMRIETTGQNETGDHRTFIFNDELIEAIRVIVGSNADIKGHNSFMDMPIATAREFYRYLVLNEEWEKVE
tara:strand:+ start:4291 stop:4608 length:318 start_codon:yes stop_codon:yes gene_type:complete